LINFMGTPRPGLRTHPMNQSIPFQCKQMRTNGVPGQPKAKSDFPRPSGCRVAGGPPPQSGGCQNEPALAGQLGPGSFSRPKNSRK
jgi:hypothetical protein